MSLFGDSFDIGAGATLGNLAVKTGYQATEEFLNASEKNAYNKMRSESFDPVVRQDLNDIMVRGILQPRNYPFPRDTEKKANFFVRHKVFWIVFLIYFIYFYIRSTTGMFVAEALEKSVAYFSVFVVIYIAVAIAKKTKRGAKKLMQAGFRKKLMNDGQQYWHIREYIRQALDAGSLSVQDAIVKISNTELGRQFPDTVDEIEANAFYYRQKLGM